MSTEIDVQRVGSGCADLIAKVANLAAIERRRGHTSRHFARKENKYVEEMSVGRDSGCGGWHHSWTKFVMADWHDGRTVRHFGEYPARVGNRNDRVRQSFRQRILCRPSGQLGYGRLSTEGDARDPRGRRDYASGAQGSIARV